MQQVWEKFVFDRANHDAWSNLLLGGIFPNSRLPDSKPGQHPLLLSDGGAQLHPGRLRYAQFVLVGGSHYRHANVCVVFDQSADLEAHQDFPLGTSDHHVLDVCEFDALEYWVALCWGK